MPTAAFDFRQLLSERGKGLLSVDRDWAFDEGDEVTLPLTRLFLTHPSWHSDVVATLSQRCGTVDNDSCADLGFRRCDNVALQSYQDLATTLLQRRHNIEHWISRPFYYRLF